MKPRYEETSYEVDKILRKAKSLADRADNIEKELVKNVTSYTTQPHSPEFHIVQGETSRHMFYYTNQSTLDSESVTNKGATSSSVDMDGLAKKLNVHDGNVKLDDAGGKDPSGQSLE